MQQRALSNRIGSSATVVPQSRLGRHSAGAFCASPKIASGIQGLDIEEILDPVFGGVVKSSTYANGSSSNEMSESGSVSSLDVSDLVGGETSITSLNTDSTQGHQSNDHSRSNSLPLAGQTDLLGNGILSVEDKEEPLSDAPKIYTHIVAKNIDRVGDHGMLSSPSNPWIELFLLDGEAVRPPFFCFYYIWRPRDVIFEFIFDVSSSLYRRLMLYFPILTIACFVVGVIWIFYTNTRMGNRICILLDNVFRFTTQKKKKYKTRFQDVGETLQVAVCSIEVADAKSQEIYALVDGELVGPFQRFRFASFCLFFSNLFLFSEKKFLCCTCRTHPSEIVGGLSTFLLVDIFISLTPLLVFFFSIVTQDIAFTEAES